MVRFSHCIPITVRGFAAVFLLSLLQPVVALAQTLPPLQLMPESPRPGGELEVRANDLVSDVEHILLMRRPGGGDELELARATSSSGGSILMEVALPVDRSGEWQLRLERGRIVVAISQLQMGPALSVVAAPIRPHAGQWIDVGLEGLEEGELLLRYDGRTVFGPQPVAAGSLTVPLQLPTEFPANLPTIVALEAVQRRSMVVSARGITPITVQLPLDRPPVRVFDLSMPQQAVNPEDEFTVSGRIEVDSGRPEDWGFSAWFIPDGDQVMMGLAALPLGSGTIRPAPNGTFSFQAVSPSIHQQNLSFRGGAGRIQLRGQPWRGQSAAGDGVDPRMLYGSTPPTVADLGPVVFGPAGGGADPTTFTVRVRSGGQPVANALVTFTDIYLGAQSQQEVPSGAPRAIYEALRSGMVNQFNASGLQYGQATVTPPGGAICPITALTGYTDANGEVSFTLDPEQMVQATLASFIRNCGQITSGGRICESGVRNISPFKLKVNASDQDLSPFADPNNPACGNWEKEMLWDIEGSVMFGMDNQLLGNPVNVYLYPKPNGCRQLDFNPQLVRGSQVLPAASRSQSMQWGGTWLPSRTEFESLPSAPDAQRVPDSVIGMRQSGWQVRVPYDPLQSGATVQSATLEFDSTGDSQPNYVVPMDIASNVEVSCESGGHVFATLPDLTRQAAGSRRGWVTVNDTLGRTYRARFDLPFQPLPAWLDARDNNLELSGSSVRFSERTQVQATRRLEGASVSSGNLDYGIGNLGNTTNNNARIWQTVGPGSLMTSQQSADSGNQIANRSGGTKSRSGSTSPGSQGVSLDLSENLFDTGRIPLFRFPWGIPPIAEATLGADFRARSDLLMTGSTRLTTTGLPQVSLTTGPSLGVDVKLFFDLSVVLGLVSAEASATAATDLQMLARTVNNQFQGVDRCFAFALIGAFEVCAAGFCGSWSESLVCRDAPNNCHICRQRPQPDACRRPFRGCMVQGIPTPGTLQKNLPGIERIPATGLGGNRLGQAMLAYGPATGGLVMRPIRLGRPSPAQIIAAAQVMSVDVAYYSNSRAITVWAEGDDAPAESLDEAAGRQHLRFARWDGEAWSEPADLTPPGSADGNVALAPCRAGSSIRCGLEGSVAAVWVRERVGDLSQRRFSVMYSVYQARNNTWSTPAPINPRAIDASYDPTQLQPTVTYLDGRPAVFWVENDARVPSSIVSRRLHYRIVGLGDPQVASTLPQGISWPSVAMSGDSQLMLSFTVATDPQAFVGNQNAVYGARANCSGGACSFVAHQLRDPRGRQIRGEAPRVQMTNDGKAQVVFRGLGFGPDASGEHFHSDDPVGIQTGLGAAVKVQLDPNALSGNVSLTNIGQGALDFYRPLAQFDTRGGGTLVIGSRRASSVEPLLKAARDYPRGVRGKVVPTMIEDELMLMALPDAPDLALRLVEHPEANIQPGGTVRIELELGNGGADFIVDPAAPTRLAAAWDGDPGVSATVISQNVVNLATNQTRTITLDVPMPADAQPDQLRWLHLALEGGITESDRDGRDNRLRVLIGGLPMPDNLRPVTRVGGEVVLLEWDAVEDERVAGYRVYALDAEGEPVAIGFTPVNGFADLTLAPGFNRTYMVTSLSASGSESAFSDAAVAALPMTDALFSDSFEPDEVLP